MSLELCVFVQQLEQGGALCKRCFVAAQQTHFDITLLDGPVGIVFEVCGYIPSIHSSIACLANLISLLYFDSYIAMSSISKLCLPCSKLFSSPRIDPSVLNRTMGIWRMSYIYHLSSLTNNTVVWCKLCAALLDPYLAAETQRKRSAHLPPQYSKQLIKIKFHFSINYKIRKIYISIPDYIFSGRRGVTFRVSQGTQLWTRITPLCPT